MRTDLARTLRAADPARGVHGYDEERIRGAVARIIEADPGPDPAAPRVAWVRRHPVRTVATVAAAAALLLSVPVWRSGGTGASPAAAELLRRAADVHAVDPPARPEQYWRITSSGTTLAVLSDPAGEFTNFLVTGDTTAYVAVDGTRPTWIVEHRGTSVRRLSGTAPEPAGIRGDRTWTGDAPALRPGSWQEPNPAFLAALPRDPQALRDRLYRDSRGQGRGTDAEVLVFVADVLSSGLVPADLRSALFRVLQDVPGVRVTTASVAVAGRAGVGIGIRDREGSFKEIVVDPASGQVIAEREIEERTTDGIPAGTAVEQLTVTRTLVDDVPAAVRTANR